MSARVERLPQLSSWQIYSIIFVAVLLLHAPLLRLPFFWDEAGFYVPAAHDIAEFHSMLPQTTLDTGHPPLSAAYLAFWFSLSGTKPAVARIAMLLLAALALNNLFLLGKRVAGTGVALAATIATALYPVFFVQSSLTHADLAAAAFTLLGLRFAMEHRLWSAQLGFSLAVLSKETAIITPLALALCELLAINKARRRDLRKSAAFLLPIVPLLCWLAYHHHATGRYFGAPEFYSYNVTAVLQPVRVLAAFVMRCWHLLGAMNMLVLTAATVAAMFFPPVTDDGVARDRIDIPVQVQFAAIMLANLLTFSLLGGALLTRYLLAVYPLVIIIGMSTLRRRIAKWQWAAAAVTAFFVVGLFVNPPYRFAPEDNLTYRDFVVLHKQAADFLQKHEPDAAVLTAWPATDELTKPYLSYVSAPISVVQAKDFRAEEIAAARQMKSKFQVVYLFSTKYEVRGSFLFGERFHQKFFDYHRDVSPELAAEFLGGKIVYLARRRAEWVAILEVDQSSSARLGAGGPQLKGGE